MVSYLLVSCLLWSNSVSVYLGVGALSRISPPITVRSINVTPLIFSASIAFSGIVTHIDPPTLRRRTDDWNSVCWDAIDSPP